MNGIKSEAEIVAIPAETLAHIQDRLDHIEAMQAFIVNKIRALRKPVRKPEKPEDAL